MVLKYSFKLFFLKCILEFMIITAPQGSNRVNGREKYFKSVNFKNINPFAPEPPVTACADPGPFYPL